MLARVDQMSETQYILLELLWELRRVALIISVLKSVVRAVIQIFTCYFARINWNVVHL